MAHDKGDRLGRNFMVEFIDAQGRAADCHPNFFPTEAAADWAGKRLMPELPWAVSYRVVPAGLDDDEPDEFGLMSEDWDFINAQYAPGLGG